MIHEAVPLGQWEFGVASGESGEEMGIPGLNGAFGGISAVVVGGDELELDLVFLECLFFGSCEHSLSKMWSVGLAPFCWSWEWSVVEALVISFACRFGIAWVRIMLESKS